MGVVFRFRIETEVKKRTDGENARFERRKGSFFAEIKVKFAQPQVQTGPGVDRKKPRANLAAAFSNASAK